MYQVLFHISLKPFDWLPSWWPDWNLPIYGFGMMLFLAFVICPWLAARRGRREGIDKRNLENLAVWIFLGGITGARLVYMIQYHEPFWRFFMIWEGGLVFYGSVIGGFTAYALAYAHVVHRQGLSTWRLADVVAPSVAVGLCLGRIGCLLNGCCYGNVAPPDCPAISFPLPSPARYALVRDGYQTAAGFTVAKKFEPATVGVVDPDSPAAASGLRAGDVIVAADGQPIQTVADLDRHLVRDWPRGKNDLSLTIDRQDGSVTLPSFVPRTLGLHPTQIYESISMILVFLLLSAFYPFRRHPGQVMVLFLICYSLHRFLNEILRNDTDPLGDGLTLSQNGSIILVAAAILLELWLWRRWRIAQLVHS